MYNKHATSKGQTERRYTSYFGGVSSGMSICSFEWIYNIRIKVEISFVWSAMVLESKLVLSGYHCNLSFVLVRLGQTVMICIDLGFFWF